MKQLVVLLALLILTVSCSSGGDDPSSSPVNTKAVYNLMAQDDDDSLLNEDMINPNAVYRHISGNGILWKPVADSGGKLVILLNHRYGKPTVKIKSRNNKLLAVGRFAYYSNPNRATYRFDRTGASFGSCYLIVGSKVFYVPNGARRYE